VSQSNNNLSNFQSKVEKLTLIAELQKLGIKNTPEKILSIAKDKYGKIIFIEIGDSDSGLQHILENHELQFAKMGMNKEQIPLAIITAILNDNIVGYQSVNRPIYEFIFEGKIQRIAVTVSQNGYIVCANPRSIKNK